MNRRIANEIAEELAVDWVGSGLAGFFEEPTYSKQVRSSLHNIIQSERGISEKSFRQVDAVIAELDGLWDSPSVEMEETMQRFETQRLRPEYCAECLYAMMY